MELTGNIRFTLFAKRHHKTNLCDFQMVVGAWLMPQPGKIIQMHGMFTPEEYLNHLLNDKIPLFDSSYLCYIGPAPYAAGYVYHHDIDSDHESRLGFLRRKGDSNVWELKGVRVK